jgi:hypothetical protein
VLGHLGCFHDLAIVNSAANSATNVYHTSEKTLIKILEYKGIFLNLRKNIDFLENL